MRHQLHDQATQLRQVGHTVVDKEYLPTAVHLIGDRLLDECLVKYVQFRLYRLPVWRRRVDDAEVACAHQRKVQRARYRRSRQRKHVHIGAQVLEFLLYTHAEFLLLIHDHQARSEEHTSELQSLMRTSYAVFCLNKTITPSFLTYSYLSP